MIETIKKSPDYGNKQANKIINFKNLCPKKSLPRFGKVLLALKEMNKAFD